MADKVIVSKTKLTALGNAIREKTSQSQNLTLDEMATSVANISEGIDTTDATATSSDILLGKTAYVNDIKVEGSIETYDGSNSEMTEPLQSTLKKLLDATKKCYYLFSGYTGTSVDDLISYNDTENVEEMEYMFYLCEYLQTIPLLNTSNVIDMQKMFYHCQALTSIPQLDTSKVANMQQMFYNCYKLQTIPQLDTSNVTNMNNMFRGCNSLKSILMYGMKVSFNISVSTKFEESDLVTIISNCQVVTSSTTLTMGRTNLAKLENVYVKETGVELYEGITCRPCVICESTDDGAMLITAYANSKNWTLA